MNIYEHIQYYYIILLLLSPVLCLFCLKECSEIMEIFMTILFDRQYFNIMKQTTK